jgi:hypothetical protein
VKYSSRNLKDPEITFPLAFPIKLSVEYCPGGVYTDSAVVYSKDPESTADEIVRRKGWDRLAGYQPSDVWVDGCM